MTEPKISITRKGYWQTPATRHTTPEEAYEAAWNQAQAAPGTVVTVRNIA